MKRRRSKGQTIVEYATSIGCVIAVCMLVLGGLGFAAEDAIRAVLLNINNASVQVQDPSLGPSGGIFSHGIRPQGDLPWNPK